ncbi:hypothetical protein [Variovorax saccharolyticus]|uniref:hypothetical protein n=1 Tax=Variovorax saccharolyticus TaxID=3053516 RepID=UPI00257658BA|nr:hypothetical protein [Variovorax sp. J22R187]MDM0022009.1 hypothetical protein [Variovorax sp. J22R187]
MFASLPARWLALVPAMGALAAMARPAPPLPEAPEAATPARYQSALEGYRRYADDQPIPWKTANEIVLLRGGWQAYAREASNAAGGDDDSTALPPPPTRDRP